MGHERVGVLPKTQRWIEIIDQMAGLEPGNVNVDDIANRTLRNIISRFNSLCSDTSTIRAFAFLVKFASSCKSDDPLAEAKDLGIGLPSKSTLMSLIKTLRNAIGEYELSNEHGQLTFAAASDALAKWHAAHENRQLSLLKPTVDFIDSWKGIGTGSGFCNLARLYFSSLTERYLKYYLERAASASIPTLRAREEFHDALHNHIDDVSKHAFETARIAQSFSAGWFNKNASEKPPDDKAIKGFLFIAFGKLRDELLREETSK